MQKIQCEILGLSSSPSTGGAYAILLKEMEGNKRLPIIIGAFELNNVKATFAVAQTRSKQQNADAILGNGSFSQFNLIFDYAGSMLYLKLNGIAEPFKINKLE